MLSELYCIFILVVPVVLFVCSFTELISSRFSNEQKMHKAIYKYFMDNKCQPYFDCYNDELKLKDLYSIKVRKPSKALKGDNQGGDKDGVLEEFYKEFEEKIKSHTGE